MSEGARGIQSIEVSGRILQALIEAGAPVMLKDLAEAAGLKPAQCHAYLTSLKNVGLVHQDWASGLYAAGSLALRLGVSWILGNAQSAAAIEAMKALSEELGVMSLITVWGQFGPTIVHIYAGPNQAALNLRQGSLFSVTGTAAGRVFAAFGCDPAIAAQVEKELAHKATVNAIGVDLTKDGFEDQVRQIRACGYSIALRHPIPQVNAVAFPVFDREGRLAFVISLIGSDDRLDVSDGASAIEQIRRIAKDVSREGAPSPGDVAALP